MNQDELAKNLAKALLMKQGGGKFESFSALGSVKEYLAALSIEELLGIATQNRIEV